MTDHPYPTIICDWCDQVVTLTYNESTIAKLQRQQACHTCGFWLDHIEDNRGRDKDNYVVTQDFEHYWIGPENDGGFAGFGGRTFEVEWFDEERGVTQTSNLWGQGTIPERFRDAMTPNAKFRTER